MLVDGVRMHVARFNSCTRYSECSTRETTYSCIAPRRQLRLSTVARTILPAVSSSNRVVFHTS